LSYLVADSLSLFVSLARDLASDLDALANLRRTLRQQLSSSPLCNGRVFTDHLEDVLRKVWYDWCDTHKGLSLKRLHSAISTEEYYNAGVNRMEEKDFRTASQLFVLSGRKRPDFPEAFNNLGICLFNIGKSHHKDAIRYVRKALRINPSFGQAYNNLGLILTETGRGRQALRYCERAVKLMPDNPDARLNIGNVYREKGLYLNALVSYNQALELDPDNFKPYNLIACLKLLYGDPIGAIENFKQANLLQPNDSAIYSNMLFAMNYVSTYSQEDIFEASCTWDRRYGQPTSTSNFENRCANGKRIRVGYVSADFQQHPVGVFFQAVSCNHNRSEFKIFCYSNGSKPDDINKKIRSTVEHWRDVEEMNDIDFSETIRKDEIDILVDLSGHTSGNRLKLFSRRAAPLQVSWLGYFNTTGIANMDYVVTDEVTVPVGCEQWYRETVVRMPHSRFCYTPPFICPDVEQLPALRNGHITFGCFNNIAKLTVEVIEVWAEILRLVPDSRLVLKWKTLSDSSVREYYLSLFSLYGISRQRIEFRGQSTLFMMREEYNDIDIALDPFPFTGGFTSCEALWMGVPVVTLAGERPVSRQTTGLLNVLGLSELSSETIDAYVECAVNISQNLERLTLLRYGMRERMISSPLCNGVEFTERLEAIYRNMYRSWKKNNK
jgi:predicted O-linked N-acetylglucosamine transferase (SPINDLY family)